MQHRLGFLDILRILAVLLVMEGHMLSAALWDIGGMQYHFGNAVTFPVLNHELFNFWKFEYYSFSPLKIQAGSLGVMIFFLISGFLMGHMSLSYSRLQFTVNRVFRIFPTYIVCLVIFVIIRKEFGVPLPSIKTFLANATLLHGFTTSPALLTLTWSLIVEMLFYTMTVIVGEWTYRKIIGMQLLMVFFMFLDNLLGPLPRTNPIANFSLYAPYLTYMLVGTSFYTCRQSAPQIISTIALFSLSFSMYAFTSITFPIEQHTLLMFVMGLGIFGVAWTLSESRMPFSASFMKTLSKKFAALTYPLYLVHIPVGIGTMLYLRDNFTTNPYVLLSAALFAVLLVAFVITELIEKPGVRLGKGIARQIAIQTQDPVAVSESSHAPPADYS